MDFNKIADDYINSNVNEFCNAIQALTPIQVLHTIETFFRYGYEPFKAIEIVRGGFRNCLHNKSAWREKINGKWIEKKNK